MSDTNLIICKPTQWFLVRAVLMLAMFSGFAAWFYRDGNTGYRNGNSLYYLSENFSRVEGVFFEKNADSTLTEKEWKAFAATQTFVFPDNAEAILPRDMDLQMPWPEELSDFQRLVDGNGVQSLWLDYTQRLGLDSEKPEKVHPEGDITEQFAFSGFCAFCALVALFFLVRTLNRKMVAGPETLILPGAGEIPYSSIVKLDNRKWNNKGLGIVYYEDRGEQKKAKIDGLCYGGFKKEEGESAEKLMQRVYSKMTGEILEYVEEEEEEESPQAEEES